MKKIFTIALALSGIIAFAQDEHDGKVGINTLPEATLDISPNDENRLETATTNEGILIPRLSKKRVAKIADNLLVEGTMVYVNEVNTPETPNPKTNKITEKGYYYYNGREWVNIKSQTILAVTTQVDYNILGYVPSTTATANTAPASVSYGTKTANKVGTHTFAGNGHSYATFLSTNFLTWYEAYEMAKSMGGYLATFTTDEEWKSVETALLEANRTFDTTGAWIGMARFEWFAGGALQPNPEMKWITGELPKHDYSARGTGAIRKQNWFTMQYYPAGHDWDMGEDYPESWGAGTEPNNGGGVEGFVHTWPKNQNRRAHNNGYTSHHAWNDIAANVQNSETNVKAFIVEFQQ